MITPQELTQIIKNYYLAYGARDEQENVQGRIYHNALHILFRQIVAENVVDEMESIDVRKQRLIEVVMQQIVGPMRDGLREAIHQEVVNACRHIEEKLANNLPVPASEVRMMSTSDEYIEIKVNHALPFFLNQAQNMAEAFFAGYQWGPQSQIFSPPKRLR